jgi:hypothetical protein
MGRQVGQQPAGVRVPRGREGALEPG